ncbi:flippase [Halorubrum distributum]|uniref:Polysaccharide biosynthesis protein n=1 Tax=Halorubrum distributum JCM 13916 TaxID=1230455 RepID=M0PLX9_9EURY|nr:flippase [Halorubrum arcis]EMA71061.1 polysaccharide biosynthesis protein [Halorubrum arcis JCM 13916]
MSDDDSGASTLATQGGITFLGKILGKGLGFFFVAVATRLVSPSEYGAFTLALSIVLFAQGFASLNIYRSVDYFVPQYLTNSDYGKAKQTLQNVFSLGIVSSFVGAGILFVAIDWLQVIFNEPQLGGILPYLVLLIPLQTVLRTLVASFNSLKEMKYRVVAQDLLNPLVRTLGAVALVTTGAGVLGLVGGYLLGVAVAVACGVVFLLYEADWIKTASSEPVSNRALLTYSLPLVLAGVIYSLVGQLDYFVIGYFMESSDVGQYRVAYLLAGNLLIVLQAITPVFKPMIAENQSDNSLLESRYQLATRWTTMLTLPLVVTLVAAPDIYLSLLFTKEYSVASAAVVALSIGYLFNASFGPEGMVLEGLGHTRLTLFNTLILVGANAVLNLILVPDFGIFGAGIATGTALTIAGAVGVLEIYLLRSISPFKLHSLSIWVAVLPSIGVAYILSLLTIKEWMLAFLIPSFVLLTYVLSLRKSGAFTYQDVKIASQVDEYLGYPVFQAIIY